MNNGQNKLLKKGEYILLRPKFQEECARLLHEVGLPRLEQMIREGKNEAAVISALKFAADRGYGGVEQNLNVQATVTHTFADTLRRVAEVVTTEKTIEAEFVEVKTAGNVAPDTDFDC